MGYKSEIKNWADLGNMFTKLSSDGKEPRQSFKKISVTAGAYRLWKFQELTNIFKTSKLRHWQKNLEKVKIDIGK